MFALLSGVGLELGFTPLMSALTSNASLPTTVFTPTLARTAALQDSVLTGVSVRVSTGLVPA